MEKDKGKIGGLKNLMDYFQTEALCPEMYVAYCKGEDFEKFFDSPVTQSKKKEKPNKKYIPDITLPAEKEILLKKCKDVCENLKLPKSKTITREMKYEIGRALYNKVPSFKSFKSGNPTYHRISKMLSELGYSRKMATKFKD